MGKLIGLRRLRYGATLAASIVLGGHAMAAVEASPPPEQTAVGHWTLMLDDTNRRCRLMLRSDPIDKMHAMGLPAGCRRAMPILSSVSRWTASSDGLRFDDDAGKPVLAFTTEKDASTLMAKGPEGESYYLTAVDGAHVDGLPKAEVAAQVTPVAAKGSAKDAAPGGANATSGPDPATLPGRYSILRRGGKDTGCELTLEAKAKGPKGSKKAILAPSCKDQGVVIFNPAGWRLDDGRLVLIAKKGHSTHLDLQGDGTWLKDPGEGAPLSLKKS